jgi:hypothetical protein
MLLHETDNLTFLFRRFAFAKTCLYFIPFFFFFLLILTLTITQFESHGAGTHKVHYQPQQQWDFIADADERPVDVSLVLPHYRARNQPTGHRMSMYIHSRAEIKSTIVSADPPISWCHH